MFYPIDAPFTEEAFLHPPRRFRGIPFWSWNTKVTREKIRTQAACFDEMGMGGAMIHPRTGLDTPYLSEEYMSLVSYAEQCLREKGMDCWLYDEERFPSGCAGGIVTRDWRYRARYLVLTRETLEGYCRDRQAFEQAAAENRRPRGYHLCDYHIVLDHGLLQSYAMCPDGEWHAYVEVMPESPWFNGETYVDVFNPDADDRFIEVTHARYVHALGEHVGRTVPAIFTDEPHMKGKHCMPDPDAQRTTLSFTDDMDDTFRAAYGRGLLEVLPEIVWETGGTLSPWRYRYHEHVTERFAAAYGDRIGKWCEAHHIAYTGHFMSERTLYSQTLAMGETMRHYRSEHFPGVDILAGQLELTTLKQAESVRRQMGRECLVCEMYGVLEWDVSFRQHKLQGDWLAALGVTARVHHLAFMSMEGEAKRDWPAAIGWQSPWWKAYPYLEDYYARLNTLLTRGSPVTHVAVVHPIESFWMRFGNNRDTLSERRQMDLAFEQLAQWLLYGCVDYDYLSESMLPSLCGEGSCPLQVGRCRYDTVIVPPVITLRSSTLQRLSRFRAQGGRLILLGDAPVYADGSQSDAASALWALGERVEMEQSALLSSLEKERDIRVWDAQTGAASEDLIYQLRQDGDCRILFLSHVRGTDRGLRTYRIGIVGSWRVRRMHALDGSAEDMAGSVRDGCTWVSWSCWGQDSLLLRLLTGKPCGEERPPVRTRPFLTLYDADAFELSEQNALLLDRCEYALDEGEWHADTEILRADNALRRMAGLPERSGSRMQPWMIPEEQPKHTAHLRYRFRSDRARDGLQIAMEQPEKAAVRLNGQPLSGDPVGWYVDEAIKVLPLPAVHPGENILTVDIPLTRRTDLEAMYVLGSFGVCVKGRHLLMTDAPRNLSLDDQTRQGLPFYTGNITYHFQISLKEDHPGAYLHLPGFAAPLARVYADGRDCGYTAWEPYSVYLGDLPKGEHEITVLAYGSRYNGFGTLHNADDHYMWYGPDAFRTAGDQWTDNYLVRPGYLAQPIILEEAEHADRTSSDPV